MAIGEWKDRRRRKGRGSGTAPHLLKAAKETRLKPPQKAALSAGLPPPVYVPEVFFFLLLSREPHPDRRRSDPLGGVRAGGLTAR